MSKPQNNPNLRKWLKNLEIVVFQTQVSERGHIFQNLLPDTVYSIQVLTLSGNGTSLPSPTLQARTLPSTPE